MVLESGKRYKQTVDAQFHLTMAALDPNSVEKGSKPVSVMVETNGTEYLLCNLHQENCLQERLDLMFAEGEEISLFANGKATVHLTGYVMPDDEFGDFEEEDDIEDEEEEQVKVPGLNGKRKKTEQLALPGKKLKVEVPNKQAIIDIDPVKQLEKNKAKNKQPAQQTKAQQQKKPAKPAVADENDDDDELLDINSDIGSEELDKMMAEAESDDDLDEEDDFDDDDDEDDDLEEDDSEEGLCSFLISFFD